MKDVRVSAERGAALLRRAPSGFQRGGKLIPFDQAKPAVEQTLLESERRQRQQAYLAELRKNGAYRTPDAASPTKSRVVPAEPVNGVQVLRLRSRL